METRADRRKNLSQEWAKLVTPVRAEIQAVTGNISYLIFDPGTYENAVLFTNEFIFYE